ncbi:MAG: hypothetical protein ACRD1T_16935, partial [Acidimicrobiia bacterium]
MKIRQEAYKLRNLFFRGGWRHAAAIVARAEQQKSEGLGEVAGRRIVVGAPIAAKPGGGGIDATQLHPAAAAFRSIEREVDGMSQFVGEIITHVVR